MGLRVTKHENDCRDCGKPTIGLFCLECWKDRAGDIYPERQPAHSREQQP